MHVIHVRNVNHALPMGVELLRTNGVERPSRNGPVIVADAPVTTVYERPWERVLFLAERDANPFFHLVEGLWMLSGRDDVAGVARYVARMKTYSDDGRTLHGAYGRRWRRATIWDAKSYRVGEDQLVWAIERLRADPEDRRVVIQMWDHGEDMEAARRGGKDVPCNTQCYVSVDPLGRVELTVTCRSNDMIWGAYGANAVHFSMLHEYLACAIGRPMGRMFQVSNNYHAYPGPLAKIQNAPGVVNFDPQLHDPYVGVADEDAWHLPLMETDRAVFDEDLGLAFEDGATIGLRNRWLRRVAVPVMMAHRAYKERDEQRFEKALEISERIAVPDWRQACQMWLRRRQEAHLRARDDGPTHEED